MPVPILVWVVAAGAAELMLLTVAAAMRATQNMSGSGTTTWGSSGGYLPSTARSDDRSLPKNVTAATLREWIRRNKTEDYCPVPKSLGFADHHSCGDAAVMLDNVWNYRTLNLQKELGTCPSTGRTLEELEGVYQRKADTMSIHQLRTMRQAPGSTGILLYDPMGGPVRVGADNHYINFCFDKQARPVFVDCSGVFCREVDLSADETDWGRIDPFRRANNVRVLRTGL